MFDSLELSDLPKMQCGILRNESSTRPVIRVVEDGGIRAVVKDFSTKRFLYRNTIARFLVWREAKAYRKLRGIRGTPNLYRIVDGLALVEEEIPGINLEKIGEGVRLPERFFDSFRDLLDKFHERGLAHCDLKKAANTILGHDGLPYIIDWGASISEREFRFFPLNLIYRRFLLDDYLAITKLKLRHNPEKVTPAEMIRYNRRSRIEKLIRAVRDRLQNTLQKIA